MTVLEIARWNDNWNKVSTKEELLELLKKPVLY